MTTQQRERFEAQLTEVGLKAARKHPRAKLWAKVNCCDNFALAVFREIEGAILDDVILAMDTHDTIESEWLNDVCANGEKKLRAFVLTIGRKAYRLLRL
jgi:hypothetical protein